MLVTGGEHVGVLAAVRALRAAGYEPWATVSRPGTYAGRSRAAAGTVAVPEPADGGPAFAAAVLAGAARIGAAAVLPGTEGALVALAGREPDFGEIALGGGSREAVDRATDKGVVLGLAGAAGLDTPPTSEGGRGELLGAPDLSFPLVVKAIRSETPTGSGRLRHSGALYVDCERELGTALDQLPGERFLAQPFLPGNLSAICGVAWEGDVRCACHQRADRIWPTGLGISAYAATVPPDEDLERAVGDLVAALGWSGIFQAQFIQTGRETFFIDFNPRIYGSLALSVAAGLNLPALWVELLLGGDPRPRPYRVGVRFRSENDVRALAAALADGRVREVLRGLAPRRGTTHAVLALNDPGPALVSLEKFRRAVLGGLGRESRP